MYYIGLMSGTSMDAVDIVLTNIDDTDIETHTYRQFPIPRSIRDKVLGINTRSEIGLVSELDAELGHLFADSVDKVLELAGVSREDVVAIGSHGQTILHLPESSHPRTLQIGDANIIAQRTGIDCITDFRRMDMAAGGQGAPLACAFHQWKFSHPSMRRVVLNIGGMANLTLLNKDKNETRGFDTGPGNALMDAWTQQHRDKPYDKDGEWAMSGQADNALLNIMLEDNYFSQPPPKSTGKDDFNLNWLSRQLKIRAQTLSVQDVQATLLELTAHSISNAIITHAGDADEIIVCGGGLHNTGLMERLKTMLQGMEICSSAVYGIDPDAMEALVFAWLARQRLEKQSANLPSVTGAAEPVILGAVYLAKAR